MSLSRAFTTRRNRKVSDLSTTSSSSSSTPDLPHRALTTKHSFQGTIRHKISAPVELLSTTNMLSYNAPDIYQSSSSSSSSASGDDVFDRSPSMPSTPLTSPDTSSIESSSPKPNHLSCYFGTPSMDNTPKDAPVIPRRAPSHTKKLSESIARQRSVSRVSSRKDSMSSTARSSMNMFSGSMETVERHNPFGLELAKVSELAEEYGMGKDQVAIVDPEEQDLISRGLFKFCAEDYMNEIRSYLLDAFNDAPFAPVSTSAMWI